ncbi:MAG: hypothetical protein LH631_09475 [Alkalinema sp. CAN_BIN05]|nr:hypothetical protein [Alkalinema sp. CAN_BIN05]
MSHFVLQSSSTGEVLRFSIGNLMMFPLEWRSNSWMEPLRSSNHPID